MNEQERQEFERLKREVEALKEEASLNEFLESKIVTDADVTVTTAVVGGGGGTVDHIDYPDRWEVVRVKGKVYLRPLYDFDRQ